jgi:hypothetical protein
VIAESEGTHCDMMRSAQLCPQLPLHPARFFNSMLPAGNRSSPEHLDSKL